MICHCLPCHAMHTTFRLCCFFSSFAQNDFLAAIHGAHTIHVHITISCHSPLPFIYARIFISQLPNHIAVGVAWWSCVTHIHMLIQQYIIVYLSTLCIFKSQIKIFHIICVSCHCRCSRVFMYLSFAEDWFWNFQRMPYRIKNFCLYFNKDFKVLSAHLHFISFIWCNHFRNECVNMCIAFEAKIKCNSF